MNARQFELREEGRHIEPVTHTGDPMLFSEIREPGAYICNWSGHLLRVRSVAHHESGKPAMDFEGRGPLIVTKLSNDPNIATAQARSLALDFESFVAF